MQVAKWEESGVFWSQESTHLAEAVPAPQREQLHELSFLLLSLRFPSPPGAGESKIQPWESIPSLLFCLMVSQL